MPLSVLGWGRLLNRERLLGVSNTLDSVVALLHERRLFERGHLLDLSR